MAQDPVSSAVSDVHGAVALVFVGWDRALLWVFGLHLLQNVGGFRG